MSDYGNPGKEYEKTRHNVGFRTIDKIAEKLNIDMVKNKFDAIVGEGKLENEKIILMKPQTYMNLSGESVKQIMNFYKLDPQNLIVIYDDIDIELGKIRIRPNGSSGTHNGMRNIIKMLNSEEFPRVRIGTGKPQNGMNLADYVLAPFSNDENILVEKALEVASKTVNVIIKNGVQSAMNEFNGL